MSKKKKELWEVCIYEILQKDILVNLMDDYEIMENQNGIIKRAEEYMQRESGHEKKLSYAGMQFSVYPGPCYIGKLKKEFQNFKFHDYEARINCNEIIVSLMSLDSMGKCNYAGIFISSIVLTENPETMTEVAGMLLNENLLLYTCFWKDGIGICSLLEAGSIIDFENPFIITKILYRRRNQFDTGLMKFDNVHEYMNMAHLTAIDLTMLLYSRIDNRPIAADLFKKNKEAKKMHPKNEN